MVFIDIVFWSIMAFMYICMGAFFYGMIDDYLHIFYGIAGKYYIMVKIPVAILFTLVWPVILLVSFILVIIMDCYESGKKYQEQEEE